MLFRQIIELRPLDNKGFVCYTNQDNLFCLASSLSPSFAPIGNGALNNTRVQFVFLSVSQGIFHSIVCLNLILIKYL